jgi:hypothetical protein
VNRTLFAGFSARNFGDASSSAVTLADVTAYREVSASTPFAADAAVMEQTPVASTTAKMNFDIMHPPPFQ